MSLAEVNDKIRAQIIFAIEKERSYGCSSYYKPNKFHELF